MAKCSSLMLLLTNVIAFNVSFYICVVRAFNHYFLANASRTNLLVSNCNVISDAQTICKSNFNPKCKIWFWVWFHINSFLIVQEWYSFNSSTAHQCIVFWVKTRNMFLLFCSLSVCCRGLSYSTGAVFPREVEASLR